VARANGADHHGYSERLRTQQSQDLVFAIVGQAGSGPSEVARQLLPVLRGRLQHALNGECAGSPIEIVRATDAIRKEFRLAPISGEHGVDRLRHAFTMQDLGDQIRSSDATNLARLVLQEITSRYGNYRNKFMIIDALRHPDEVRFFRSIYGESLLVVGVACAPDERWRRLRHKFSGAREEDIHALMRRDEGDEDNSAGQQVAKAFQLADVFVDNTELREVSDQPNPAWRVPEALQRLVDLVLQTKIIPPTAAETAMHAAFGAAMRSACLSRQVGAALVDDAGHLLAAGCNDVPKAGGGLYGEGLASPHEHDHRCFAFAGKEAYCRNNREQSRMMAEIADAIMKTFSTCFDPQRPDYEAQRLALIEVLRKSAITSLTEFSRAVHAEMAALLAAARQGISPVGASLFVTTFPCHSCARHIVAAGIKEVQYIEPYRKSKAIALHDDAVTILPGAAKDGAKVLFRPYTGVAPRRYRQFFCNERELKERITGERRRPVPPAPWGRPGQQLKEAQTVAEQFGAK
jgi:deoxycytidylate deaminase